MGTISGRVEIALTMCEMCGLYERQAGTPTLQTFHNEITDAF
jgi:hypothetical protein